MSVSHAEYDYDLVVLGGGSAGYAAGRTAVAEGLKTLVIEGGEEVGGLCILRGCMPTKALLYAAEVLHLAGHGADWGLRLGQPGFELAAVIARKDRLIAEFADYRRKQLRDARFKFLRAQARFTDPHTVALSTGERVRAAGFIIATGSVLASAPLPQLERLGCLDSDTALKLSRLPRSVVVLGGGAVAVEFAQFFRRFGVDVTLVQRSPHLLREFDDDAATELERVFRREGMQIYAGTRLLDAGWAGESKEVVFEHQGQTRRAQAEEVFLALGRRPNLAALGLEAIGVRIEAGRIATDPAMQTSVPHIYAAGDCTGPHEIVHVAIQQGEIAAHNLAHPERKRQLDDRLLIEVVFTEPQVAVAGLTEKRAQAQKISYRAASYPFADHGKSLIMEAKDGFVKLLADPATGEILGGACVGPQGGELIHEIVVALAKHVTVHELASLPHYHPTLAEIWTYPAEALAAGVSA